MKELIFFNKDSPKGYQQNTITCSEGSVERIVQWYGAFHAGDRVTLHIDGVKQKLDQNLELIQ
jgi:hypothetical protein